MLTIHIDGHSGSCCGEAVEPVDRHSVLLGGALLTGELGERWYVWLLGLYDVKHHAFQFCACVFFEGSLECSHVVCLSEHREVVWCDGDMFRQRGVLLSGLFADGRLRNPRRRFCNTFGGARGWMVSRSRCCGSWLHDTLEMLT